MTWQLQEAKNKFSEVVEATLTQGPQIITRRGKNTVVVMGYAQYKKDFAPNKNSLKKTLMMVDLEGLDLSRDPSVTGRATEFTFE